MKKKHIKPIQQKSQIIKSKQSVRYNCIYNKNGICRYNMSVCTFKYCVGNKLCNKYKYFYDNTVKIDLRLVNDNIQINISIYNIKLSEFIKTSNAYELTFRGIDKHGIIVCLNINFYNLESFIRFILNENNFNFNIKRTSESIIMSLGNIKEIAGILDTPYSKLPEKLHLSQKIYTQDLQIQIRILISKQQLFKYIEKICNTQNNTTTKLHSNAQENVKENANIAMHKNINHKPQPFYEKQVGITAIVLSNNRKCIFNCHSIEDLQAILRLATKDGKVVNYSIPAAYCKECDAYFVLKNDFEKAKLKGVILCPVIDKTTYINRKKYHIQNSGGESRIHEMGYNVRKGNKCTDKQRHIVLANILENTNISKHEIQSNIDRCIRQHQKQSNYASAIKCWINDYQFISTYKHGDIPQVIIEKIKIGR